MLPCEKGLPNEPTGQTRGHPRVERSTAPPEPKLRRHQARTHASKSSLISVLRQVWEAADYPWSVRLKALPPHWWPWIRQRFPLTSEVERQLLAISPRQIDRRLARTFAAATQNRKLR